MGSQAAAFQQRSENQLKYVYGEELINRARIAQDKFNLGPGATHGFDLISDSRLFPASRQFYKAAADLEPYVFHLAAVGTDNSPATMALRQRVRDRYIPNYWDSDAVKQQKLNNTLQLARENRNTALQYLKTHPNGQGKIVAPTPPKTRPVLESEKIRRDEERTLAERRKLGLGDRPEFSFGDRFDRTVPIVDDALNAVGDVITNAAHAPFRSDVDFRPGDTWRNSRHYDTLRYERYGREHPLGAAAADLSGAAAKWAVKALAQSVFPEAKPMIKAGDVIYSSTKYLMKNTQKQRSAGNPLPSSTPANPASKRPGIASGTYGADRPLDTFDLIIGDPSGSSITPARTAATRQVGSRRHAAPQPMPQAAPDPHLGYDYSRFSVDDRLSGQPDPDGAQGYDAPAPGQSDIIYHPHAADFHHGGQDPAAGLYASPDDMAHGAGYGSGQPGQSATPAYQIGPFFDANGMPIDQSRQTGPFSFAVPSADQGTADFYAQLGNLRRDADAMAAGPYPNPGDAARAAQLVDPRSVYPTQHPYGFGAGFAPDQVASGRPYAVAPQGFGAPADDQGGIVYHPQSLAVHYYDAQPDGGVYSHAEGDPRYGLSYDDGTRGYAPGGSDGFDFASPAYVHAGGWQHPADIWAAHGSEQGLLVAAPGARFGYGSAAPAPVIGGIISLGLGAPARSDGSGSGSGSVPLYSSYNNNGGGDQGAQPDVSIVADPPGWSPRSAVRSILAIAPDDGQGPPNWLDPNTPPPQIMLNIPDLSGLIR